MSVPLPRPSVYARKDRTILVVEREFDHTVALHGEVAVVHALIRPVPPEHLAQAVADAVPFPFAIIGVTARGAVTPEIDAAVAAVLRQHPVLLWWQGARPEGLPSHVRRAPSWNALLEQVRAALRARVGGMELSVQRGVVMPDDRVAQSPELEGLVAGHPQAWEVGPEVAARVNHVLAYHQSDWRAVRRGSRLQLECRGC